MIQLAYLAVMFLAIALGIMMLIWPPDRQKTLSQNAARNRFASVYYAVVFVFFFILFTPFFFTCFQVDIFRKIYIIGMIAQLVAVCVPELPVAPAKLHRFAAGVMSLSALVLVCIIQVTPLAILSALYMVSYWILYIRKSDILKRHALVMQLIYFTGFLATIISIAAGYKT